MGQQAGRIDSVRINPADTLFASDSADVTYKGGGSSIPIDFFISYAFDRYRVGVGGSIEFHTIGTFTPSTAQDILGTFQPATNKTRFTRYYIMGGYEIYKYDDYYLSADLRIGKNNLGKGFDKTNTSHRCQEDSRKGPAKRSRQHHYREG